MSLLDHCPSILSSFFNVRSLRSCRQRSCRRAQQALQAGVPQHPQWLLDYVQDLPWSPGRPALQHQRCLLGSAVNQKQDRGRLSRKKVAPLLTTPWYMLLSFGIDSFVFHPSAPVLRTMACSPTSLCSTPIPRSMGISLDALPLEQSAFARTSRR